jgi:hypothetical protein
MTEMSPVDTLIEQLNQARERLKTVLAQVDRRWAFYPPWTLDQLLAHLAGWDECVTDTVRAFAAGGELQTPAQDGIDAYNARSVERRAGLDYDALLRELNLSRAELLDALRRVPAERLAEPLTMPWARPGSVARMVHVLAEHDLEHAEEIEHLLSEAR